MDTTKERPKKIRPASTVILAREYERELQVYLLRRSTKSGFFPGNYVFPGGALDAEEGDVGFWQGHLDRPGEVLPETFGPGLGVEDLIAYGVAAIRETLEEAGVFLARKMADGHDISTRGCERPGAGVLKEGWFRKKVLAEGWRLSFSDLLPWSHWITPEAMPKRFDTRFFVAPMPEGQECVPDDLETVHGLWVSPRKGLQGNMDGHIPLSPPTLVTLHELLPFGTLTSLFAACRSRSWGKTVLPILNKVGQEAVLVEPWDSQYGQELELSSVGLIEKVLPLGEPFSRLWLHQGIWKPIKD